MTWSTKTSLKESVTSPCHAPSGLHTTRKVSHSMDKCALADRFFTAALPGSPYVSHTVINDTEKSRTGNQRGKVISGQGVQKVCRVTSESLGSR